MTNQILIGVIDENGWAAIIGAIGVIILQVVAMVLSHLREQAKISREVVSAIKVEEIHKTTNSMKDALVESTRLAANLQGGVDERARADLLAAKLGDVAGAREVKV